MGTAFSTEHAQLLKKLLPNGTIYILFDGDASGKEAAMAADKELRKIQVRPLAYSLFHDQDPDDLVRQYGYSFYHLIKQEAKTIAQLRIEKILANYNHYTNWLRLYTTEQLVEILEELPEGDNKEWLEKESYLLMITDALRLNEEELRQRLLKQESTPQSVNTVEAS
jgi:DNA primase